ncbi:DNA-directed RNA polymerase III subunit rpc6 [Brachypodium distachyon]|nr:DNA-directed RNA polymerase III subunit rpc6 [Brachypodium distachyon]|eukprot:XP_003576976.2 DNA-directed RNA polymerase III subunit rpc6 [Brachypodium distachyon]
MALPTSDPILGNLRGPQQQVCIHVFAAGSHGMSSGDLQAALDLTPATVTRLTNALVVLGVLKKVPAVRSPRFRNRQAPVVFMDARVEPSAEITGGGRWHHGDGKVDAPAVALARRACLDQIDRLPGPAATPSMVHAGLVGRGGGGPAGVLSVGHVAEVLRAMALGGVLEECRNNTGEEEGEFGGLGQGRCATGARRAGAPAWAGAMEEFPCGVCPVIGQCSPDGGLVSPATCVYFNKWLEMDF